MDETRKTGLPGDRLETGKEPGGGSRRSGSRKDLTGTRFGKLTVLGPAKAKSGRPAWRCRCDCGNETVVLGLNLASGRTKSCGCGRARLDLAGMKFGKLTALEPAANIGQHTAWKCLCDCGNEAVVRTSELRSAKAKSCGCLREERLDLTGDKYGMLTVLGRAPDTGGQAAWRCQCDCGNETVVRMCDLRTGHTRSCGCLVRGQDLTGLRFGRLVVLERAGTIGKSAAWLCRCDCGSDVKVRADNLLSGGTRSCGCLRRDVMRNRMEGARNHARA